MTDRIALQSMPRDWLNGMAVIHHYMHRPVHQRANPFGWAVTFDGDVFQPDCKPCGFIMFASIHFTRLRGEFGYPGLPTKWQVLSLARLWLHPNLQRGGCLYSPDNLPGFTDRKGVFRSTLATGVIDSALEQVQRRWLEVHPPVDVRQPYHVRKVISFADTRYHEGTIYKMAGFRFIGNTVSARRHKNTRGSGMDGAVLARYVYDLDRPKWKYQDIVEHPVGVQLELI